MKRCMGFFFSASSNTALSSCDIPDFFISKRKASISREYHQFDSVNENDIFVTPFSLLNRDNHSETMEDTNEADPSKSSPATDQAHFIGKTLLRLKDQTLRLCSYFSGKFRGFKEKAIRQAYSLERKAT